MGSTVTIDVVAIDGGGDIDIGSSGGFKRGEKTIGGSSQLSGGSAGHRK